MPWRVITSKAARNFSVEASINAKGASAKRRAAERDIGRNLMLGRGGIASPVKQ